jgi:hypothetical protein
MRGAEGQHTRNALRYQAANHREIIERADAVALANYRINRIRAIHEGIPAELLPPDYADLTTRYLIDLSEIAKIEAEEADIRRKNREPGKGGRRM